MDSSRGRTIKALPTILLKNLIDVLNIYMDSVSKSPNVLWHTGKAEPWTLGLWTLERLDSGCLDSGPLEPEKLLNGLQMIITIQTCYNWYYNSNFLARQQLSLKHNFS